MLTKEFLDRKFDFFEDLNTTEWDYDPMSFKVSKVTNPEGQEERFNYDLNDRLVSRISKDGTSVNLSYDLKGRLKSRTSISQSSVFSYDKDDLLVIASNSEATLTRNYDQHGRLISTESSHIPGKIVLTYDERGLRKTLNYVINGESVLSVNYLYNERKLLSEINATIGGQPVTWQRYWDELGRPETDILSNGLKVQRAYDAAGKLTYLSNEYANGEPLSRFELSYNTTGTIKEILKTFIQPDQPTPGQYVLKYQFDDLNRLIYASTDGGISYDVMGNQTYRGQIHNDLNHLLEDADYSYIYTTNGQLAQKVSKITGEKTEYTWNSGGKVIETILRKSDGTIKSIVENKYDAFNRRIVRKSMGNEVRFAYDSEDIIAEFGENDSLEAIYLHGPGLDQPIAMARDVNKNGAFEAKEVFFYSKDHLNSVHDLTDYQGKPVQRYNYSAYGKTKIEKTNPNQQAELIQNPYAYTSREWEQEIGDYYYRDRIYDPSVGRFLSEDRIRFKGRDTNLYRYVFNNPISYTDPLGLWTVGVGVGGSFGFYGGGGSADTQIVIDGDGNIGIANTVCAGGVSEVGGAAIGGIFSAGNANTINDLGGFSGNTGVVITPAPGINAGGGVTFGNDSCGNPVTTGNLFAGVGAGVSPIDMNGSSCYTAVIPLW